MNRSRAGTSEIVTIFSGSQELSMRLSDVDASRLSRIFKVDVVYLERDDGEEPAIFPKTGGRFECLSPGRRYRLCGDITNPSTSASSSTASRGHSVLGVVGETLSSSLSKSTAASTAPPPGRSWSGFQSVAPLARRSGKSRATHKVLEVKKNVDMCTVEVINGRLQLGDVRSSTFIRVVESDVCLATITDLVHNRFEAIIPEGDTIVLVDTRAVPFADDEGTRDPDFWRSAARKVSAVLQSDLDAMREYLDVMRDTSTTAFGRKRMASTPAIDISGIPPRASCQPSDARSAHSIRYFGGRAGLDTDLDDVMQELGSMQLTMARVEEGVDQLDRKLDQHTIAGSQRVYHHPRPRGKVLATAVLKTLQCSICHLVTRPPVSVTTCCRQWLGCHDCMIQCSARRCPLCNKGWSENKPISLRGLDDLTKIAREVGTILGRQHRHSSPDAEQNISSDEEELPPLFTSAPARHSSATTSAVTVTLQDAEAAAAAAASSPEIIDA